MRACRLLVVIGITCFLILQLKRLGQYDAESVKSESLMLEPHQALSSSRAHPPPLTDRFEWFWNADGCLSQQKMPPQLPSKTSLDRPPKGLVVTMALAPKNPQHLSQGRDQICNNLPNQWEWFLHPQQMDMLLVVQDEDRRWNAKRFTNCLNKTSGGQLVVHHRNSTRTWNNLDGTQLVTQEYDYRSTSKIYIASTKVQFPRYIQRNPHLLGALKTNDVPGCSARLRYLQGNRWYTREMLHLAVLEEYDFFLKMDTDIVFERSADFYILHDMTTKGALFAHAAEYRPHGDGSCARGLLHAVNDFCNHSSSETSRASSSERTWSYKVCSSHRPEVQRDADQYYCNFIIGSVSYFTSPWVRRFADWMSEYPKGFFFNRWGDQVFWHYALGVFLDDFVDHVVDYTNLRCMPKPGCWYSVFDTATYGANVSERCDNGGLFLHTKSLEVAKRVGRRRISNANRSQDGRDDLDPAIPFPFAPSLWQRFNSTYANSCS